MRYSQWVLVVGSWGLRFSGAWSFELIVNQPEVTCLQGWMDSRLLVFRRQIPVRKLVGGVVWFLLPLVLQDFLGNSNVYKSLKWTHKHLQKSV